MNTIKIRNNSHKNRYLSRHDEEKTIQYVMYNYIIFLYLSRQLLVSEGVQQKKKKFKLFIYLYVPFLFVSVYFLLNDRK